ncbi:MAG TPA: type II toxin-antitoxin system RelE/ParE family toxin [Oligoflexia bacterium]|nr:type II toxin-antitoxin system RelE/ParE family toxin [Oligoflexia bacterium]
MSCVKKREAAKRDLVEQFVWYAENAGLEVADRFLVAADNSLVHLSEMPEMGSPVFVSRQELAGIRRWPIKGFEKIFAFYFPLSDGIDVIRVLHGGRDLQKLFD